MTTTSCLFIPHECGCPPATTTTTTTKISPFCASGAATLNPLVTSNGLSRGYATSRSGAPAANNNTLAACSTAITNGSHGRRTGTKTREMERRLRCGKPDFNDFPVYNCRKGDQCHWPGGDPTKSSSAIRPRYFWMMKAKRHLYPNLSWPLQGEARV